MRAGWVVMAGVAVVLAAGCGSSPSVPDLHMSGIAEQPCSTQAKPATQAEPAPQVVPVPPRVPRGTGFVPGSSVLTSMAGGSCAAAAVADSERWLASGLVPGESAAERELAARALLDLRLSVLPDGAVIAGYHTIWEYTWPRDSSWVAVALADTGHGDQALSILRFLQRMQPADGIWAARYQPDGSGPVTDGRPAELDGDGWVPWAVWCWAVSQRVTPGSQARGALIELWPMVVRAADAATAALTGDGLPRPAMDYFEHGTDVTLGTAAPLLAGLRAATDLAGALGAGTAGTQPERARWAAAAARLSAAITAKFGGTGYQRTPDAGAGQDAAVTFLGPPFAAADAAVVRAAARAERALAVPNGGLRPGESWQGAADVAWTPETAMFALFDVGTGRLADSRRLVSWLTAHRTSLAELPEQVGPSGQPVSVAPLAWSDAVVLLTLIAQDHPLTVIPG